MIFTTTFFLNKLFDFDLTFVAELVLFVTLSLVVTFKFIAPISKEIDDAKSASSRIILGQVAESGTGKFSLLQTKPTSNKKQVK